MSQVQDPRNLVRNQGKLQISSMNHPESSPLIKGVLKHQWCFLERSPTWWMSPVFIRFSHGKSLMSITINTVCYRYWRWCFLPLKENLDDPVRKLSSKIREFFSFFKSHCIPRNPRIFLGYPPVIKRGLLENPPFSSMRISPALLRALAGFGLLLLCKYDCLLLAAHVG